MSQASAPGKIILFGEHAVVYGRPAIAAPVTDVRTTVTVEPAANGVQRIISRKIDLDVRLDEILPGFWGAEVLNGVRNALDLEAFPPFKMTIDSSIPVASGMGSGAAVAVAAIRALARFAGKALADETVNRIAFETEKLHHGTPSGIDNTVVTFARPVYFVQEQPIEILKVPAPFTVVIADTGIPSPTALSVGDLRRAWTHDRARYEEIFDHIGALAREARAAIESGHPDSLGRLMDENHRWLYEVGVSSPELDTLVNAARSAGAAGAKLSGGGRGGNIVALATPDSAPRIAAALSAAGATATIITSIGD